MSHLNDVNRKRIIAEVIIFLGFTTILSGIFWYIIIFRNQVFQNAPLIVIAGLMWSVAVSACVAQYYFHGHLRGLGFGRGNFRLHLVAFLLPIAYAAPVYAIAWWLGFAQLTDPHWPNYFQLFGIVLVLTITRALGEEIGWRGFLVPRLYTLYGYTLCSIISGLIWVFWHYPLIFFSFYNADTGFVGVVCFTLTMALQSFAYAWLRIAGATVWVAALLHGSHNFVIQTLFDRLTLESDSSRLMLGEFGYGLVFTSAIVALIFWFKRNSLPDSEKTVR